MIHKDSRLLKHPLEEILNVFRVGMRRFRRRLCGVSHPINVVVHCLEELGVPTRKTLREVEKALFSVAKHTVLYLPVRFMEPDTACGVLET